MFKPALEILPEPQRELWNELGSTPEDFALYGGTAIALQLGHRISVDFDFFSPAPFQPFGLMEKVPYLRGGIVRQSEPNTLTVSIERNGPVKVSFFGGLSLGQVKPFETAQGADINIASLIDMAGMKAAVVTQRAELKDYLDIHALLTQAKLELPVMLSAASIIYADAIKPLIALKAISYHDDPALVDLPLSMRRDLVEAVRKTKVSNLPELSAIRSRTTKNRNEN